jgi:hypothetical protein
VCASSPDTRNIDSFTGAQPGPRMASCQSWTTATMKTNVKQKSRTRPRLPAIALPVPDPGVSANGMDNAGHCLEHIAKSYWTPDMSQVTITGHYMLDCPFAICCANYFPYYLRTWKDGFVNIIIFRFNIATVDTSLRSCREEWKGATVSGCDQVSWRLTT